MLRLTIGPDSFAVRSLNEAIKVYQRRAATSPSGPSSLPGLLSGIGTRKLRILPTGKVFDGRAQMPNGSPIFPWEDRAISMPRLLGS